jgi:hypothetical protein
MKSLSYGFQVSFGLEYELIRGSCENGDEPSGSAQCGEYFDSLAVVR